MREFVTQDELEDMFADCLNDSGTVLAAGIEFYPSDILKNCDPVAWRCGLADYADSLVDDGYEVEGY